MTSLGFVALLLLAILGTPLFVIIIGAAMLGFYANDIPLEVLAVEIYRIADTPMLIALPLFTLTGYLLAESKTSERVVRVSQALLGWLHGGLSIIALVCCALFTACTGRIAHGASIIRTVRF